MQITEWIALAIAAIGLYLQHRSVQLQERGK